MPRRLCGFKSPRDHVAPYIKPSVRSAQLWVLICADHQVPRGRGLFVLPVSSGNSATSALCLDLGTFVRYSVLTCDMSSVLLGASDAIRGVNAARIDWGGCKTR
jgi:hypothetical protein